MEKVGEAFGNEALEYDFDLVLGPGLNIHRNPRNGRNFEYYSEDPLLTGKIAAAMVKGMQSWGIGATLKHFVANNQETNRQYYNAVVGQRALREIYLKGFEIAVKEGRPRCIMTSYNRLNGFYTAENPELLKTIVRQEWGFDGFFITDFDGKGSAVAKLRAGTNLLMSGHEEEYAEIKAALKRRTLDERTLDEDLTEFVKFKLNSPRANGHVATGKPDLKAHAEIARRAAAEGMVLLKNNDHTLPLKNVRKIAVFGKMSYYLIAFGTGSGSVRSHGNRVSVNEGLKDAGFGGIQGVGREILGLHSEDHPG